VKISKIQPSLQSEDVGEGDRADPYSNEGSGPGPPYLTPLDFFAEIPARSAEDNLNLSSNVTLIPTFTARPPPSVTGQSRGYARCGHFPNVFQVWQLSTFTQNPLNRASHGVLGSRGHGVCALRERRSCFIRRSSSRSAAILTDPGTVQRRIEIQISSQIYGIVIQ